MLAYRGMIAILAAAFCGLIVWAWITTPISESFSRIVSDPWGLVTLVDLYLGFVLISVLILMFEGSVKRSIIWIVPIYFLGNAWTALWVIARLPRLVERLKN